MDTNRNSYDYGMSVLVAGIIGAEPLRCWRNAALAVILLPRLFSNGSYVEGWIVLPRESIIEIIEHGWSIMPGRGIVDPSIVFTEKQNQTVFYFPGSIYSSDRLSQLLPGSTLPLVCHSHYGDDGMKHRGYGAAYQQAWQRAQELAKEKHLPQTAIKVSGRDSRRGITIIVE